MLASIYQTFFGATEQKNDIPPHSAIDNRLQYNHDNWVVSIIHTGDIAGGHAKLVVEGLRDDPEWLARSGGSNVFVGEYHIGRIDPRKDDEVIAAVDAQNADSVPEYCQNIQGRISIFCTEMADYRTSSNSREKVLNYYKNSRSRSWENIPKDDLLDLIKHIKEEKDSPSPGLYQKAGNKRMGGNDGHNCATWVIEKLSRINKLKEDMNSFPIIHPMQIFASPPVKAVKPPPAFCLVL